MNILGIPISTAQRKEFLTEVEKFLVEPKFHRIATVNPEFLVLADTDQVFKNSLLAADLCVADGFGIVLAGLLRGQKMTRLTGVDLLHEILTIAERDGLGVYLAIKKDGLSSYEEIRVALLRKYPKLIVSGENLYNEQLSYSTFNIQHSNIILCNFGAPEQELFLESIRKNRGDVRLAMGIGGSFDFLTGKQKRAPQCLRIIGLEWLWRLILQPKRWKRIWNAVIVFPVKVLFQE